jgi:hypothetical protein
MSTLRTVILSALVAMPGLASAATFRVGAGSGCTHATIQDAIDDAADDPDVADFIRATRGITYADIHLDVHDQHLVLEGGYANCATDAEDDTRTALNGNGDDSVIRIHGSGDIVLRKLTLSGGHQPLFDYGYGGGIRIDDGPHLVSLEDVFVTGNEAGHGGGISVRNGANGDPAFVRLVLGDGVVVSFNHAEFAPTTSSGIQGGGIYCNESSIVWNGGGTTSVLSNTASLDGGGIGAEECDLVIAPHGTYGSFNGLVLNEAGRDGGGLAVAGDSGGGTSFYVTDPDRPVYVAGNSAGREGGGIKLNTGAHAIGWDLILDGNRSFDEGGGVSVFAGGSTLDLDESVFEMRASLEGAPDAAVHCAAGNGCNSISGNIAEDDSGVPQQGAAIRVMANGGFGGNLTSTADVAGVVIEGNSGANLARLRVDCDSPGLSNSILDLRGAAIFGNSLSGSLILNADSPLGCYGNLNMSSTTIGGNAIGGTNVIGSNDHISVVSSIVWQPGRRALDLDGIDEGDVQYLVASDLTGIPPSPTNFVADPRFLDPERGDFHLHASSPAFDFAPTSGAVDVDGAPRSVNLALVPDDGFGPQDAGAYERQSIGNLVRNADFDEDLHIWTNAAPAATSWYADDHAGAATSGSLEVYDLSTATRVVGLSQCVGIPGPGVYRLGGFALSWENIYPAVPDHPILGWALRRDSADCTAAPLDAGEAPAPAAGGWQPLPAQYIVVGGADWTPGTTVEVQLIQEKTANPLGGDSNPVLFDGIVLVPDSDRIFADGFDGV